ncbi:reverse transcriptase [Caerostris extrusa]|uniref:Reverse transcriptase n=1 Tax=Caerostris extrusa TaxID=172846 RepID=A0AAV4SDJ6_CAEEX|nr:reverse transcriptase [Caerostris extrusa]
MPSKPVETVNPPKNCKEKTKVNTVKKNCVQGDKILHQSLRKNTSAVKIKPNFKHPSKTNRQVTQISREENKEEPFIKNESKFSDINKKIAHVKQLKWMKMIRLLENQRIFLHLPTSVQSILASISHLTLPKATEVVYRILGSEFDVNCCVFCHYSNSRWRLAGDFRVSNAQANKDKHSIPCILHFTDELQGCKILSHVDLVKAFHQIPIAPNDIHKNRRLHTIQTLRKHAYAIWPLQVSSTFQCCIDEVRLGLERVYALIEGILIVSKRKHMPNLTAHFQRLNHYGLTLKLSTCPLAASSLILGFPVSKEALDLFVIELKPIKIFQDPKPLHNCTNF